METFHITYHKERSHVENLRLHFTSSGHAAFNTLTTTCLCRLRCVCVCVYVQYKCTPITCPHVETAVASEAAEDWQYVQYTHHPHAWLHNTICAKEKKKRGGWRIILQHNFKWILLCYYISYFLPSHLQCIRQHWFLPDIKRWNSPHWTKSKYIINHAGSLLKATGNSADLKNKYFYQTYFKRKRQSVIF